MRCRVAHALRMHYHAKGWDKKGQGLKGLCESCAKEGHAGMLVVH